MQWWISGRLIGCAGILFTAVICESTFGQQVPPRPKAGFCRDCPCVGPGCAQQQETGQSSSGQQSTSTEKDRSPCGPNPPDRGFVYKNQRGDGTVHADPSAGSEVVGTPPNGSRLMYDRVSESGGRRWYHVNPPGGRSGWLPASDVSCERPTNSPPPKPDRIRDCDIPLAETHGPSGMGGRGLASSSACDEYQRQHEPISFR
jgi:hypothetical protein